jgi:hypothetical protein
MAGRLQDRDSGGNRAAVAEMLSVEVKFRAVKSSKAKMTKERFDRIVAENQEIQKRHPFGSDPHRQAYEAIKRAVKDFHGQDIGEYED